MTDDRDLCEPLTDPPYDDTFALRQEAADEITRLRAEVERLRGAAVALIDFHNAPVEQKRPDVFILRMRALAAAIAEREETQDKQRWRHKQRGTTYAVEGIAMLQTAEPLSDYTQLIVYRCERTGDLWARSVSEFRDGRFEQITSQEKTND
jgi:hypothetical protein